MKTVKLTVTEGIAQNPVGSVVRCFFNEDFNYGIWVPQTEVETVTKQLDHSSKTALVFTITEDEANKLIAVGNTPYKKKYIQ